MSTTIKAPDSVPEAYDVDDPEFNPPGALMTIPAERIRAHQERIKQKAKSTIEWSMNEKKAFSKIYELRSTKRTLGLLEMSKRIERKKAG